MVRLMQSVFAVFVACLLYSVVFAIEASAQEPNYTVTWNLPSSRTNGDALPKTEIRRTEIKCNEIDFFALGAVRTVDVFLPPGDYSCIARVIASSNSDGTGESFSDYSDEDIFTVPVKLSEPNAPTGLGGWVIGS